MCIFQINGKFSQVQNIFWIFHLIELNIFVNQINIENQTYRGMTVTKYEGQLGI